MKRKIIPKYEKISISEKLLKTIILCLIRPTIRSVCIFTDNIAETMLKSLTNRKISNGAVIIIINKLINNQPSFFSFTFEINKKKIKLRRNIVKEIILKTRIGEIVLSTAGRLIWLYIILKVRPSGSKN